MVLRIKNMVCNRCISAVEELFKDIGFKNFNISLGQVEIEEEDLTDEAKSQLSRRLINLGFELIDDKNSKIIESIKNLVVSKIHYEELTEENFKWSEIISKAIHYDYKYLSRLFSSVEGITIEQYIIHQKIEKVKEMIVYDELTLSEIAWKLGYSSVAHVSNQFKKVTGMSPREFKQIGTSGRKPLDKV